MTDNHQYQAHGTAVIDTPCSIGNGTRIWHFSHICAHTSIGQNCSFGQNTMVASQVTIGNRVKVQNNVSIYTGTTIEDEVFLGPSCVLTNVSNPRSQVNRQSLYEKTLIRRGATIGANATIVCGITIGRYAFIAAGTVVTQSVPDYGLVIGVPGKLRGWMSRHGHRIHPDANGHCQCPESGFQYLLENNQLRCLTCHEEDPLPSHLAAGAKSYRDFKSA
jgi:UDP-2-acetamido-3-amino-2,3-dideoxy-glucuronate N-acetyltransferase